MDLKITPSGQTIVKPTALGPVANTDTKLLIYGLFQKGRVLAQDGMNFGRLPLIVTDGFEFYQKVIRRFFGPACLYGQVLKTRRNDRIIKVERRALHGTTWRFEDALNNSEDSSTWNTSFIERLNLTIRQSSAYVLRRTLSHARSTERLDEHMELLRCYLQLRPTARSSEVRT